MSSFGVSAVMRASHSIAVPAGPFTTQCDMPGPVVRTDFTWYMKRGKFSNSRQNAYNSCGVRLTTTLRVIRMPPAPRLSRVSSRAQ